MEVILGPKLLTKAGKPEQDTAKLFKDKEILCLYFSASWCPPCKAFSPILGDFYNAIAKQGKLEIVFVSSDRTIPEFEGYYKKMPYLAIPSTPGSAQIKNSLAQQLNIQGIPMLIVLDAKTGDFITATAREDVTKVGRDKEKGLALIAKWKEMEAVPLAEANLGGGGPSGLSAILNFFLKNPMSIFGLLYLFKTGSRYYRETILPSFSSGLPDSNPVEVPMPEQNQQAEDMDSEF